MVQQPPSGPGPPHYQGFMITDTAHSVGLLWTSDQPVAETSTRQLTTFTETSMPLVGFEPTVQRNINIKLLLIAEHKGEAKRMTQDDAVQSAEHSSRFCHLTAKRPQPSLTTAQWMATFHK